MQNIDYIAIVCILLFAALTLIYAAKTLMKLARQKACLRAHNIHNVDWTTITTESGLNGRVILKWKNPEGTETGRCTMTSNGSLVHVQYSPAEE